MIKNKVCVEGGGGLMSFKLSQKYIDFIKDMDVDADFLEGT